MQRKTWIGIASVILVAAAFGGAKPSSQSSASARQVSALAQVPFFGVFSRARENARRASCLSNLKQLSLGILQYTQDYDEKYPPAKKWGDAIYPYVFNRQVYQCPSVVNSKDGYAMNWRFSGKLLGDVQSPAETVTLYDSRTLKRNAVGIGGKDIAFRHLGGANYAYTDGHVKWSPAKSIPSFLLNPNRARKNAPRR